jgi:hypothetical protein
MPPRARSRRYHCRKGQGAAALNALDAAWAIYVGGAPNCGLWTVSLKRANEFGTKVDCEKRCESSQILSGPCIRPPCLRVLHHGMPVSQPPSRPPLHPSRRACVSPGR